MIVLPERTPHCLQHFFLEPNLFRGRPGSWSQRNLLDETERAPRPEAPGGHRRGCVGGPRAALPGTGHRAPGKPAPPSRALALPSFLSRPLPVPRSLFLIFPVFLCFSLPPPSLSSFLLPTPTAGRRVALTSARAAPSQRRAGGRRGDVGTRGDERACPRLGGGRPAAHLRVHSRAVPSREGAPSALQCVRVTPKTEENQARRPGAGPYL